MAEPDLSRVYAALRKADAAGNTADAKRLADYIRAQRAAAAPAVPEETSAEEQGLMGHLRGALRGAAAEREPGLMRSFLELAAQPPGEGPLAAAVQRAGDVVPGAQPLAAAAQSALTDQTYAEARREQEERSRVGQGQYPTASGAGAVVAIVAQLGGPKGVLQLLKTAPQMARALVSRGLLTKEAILGALQGAGATSGVGALLSDADIPLAEGRPGEAAEQAASAALDPAMLATGGALGAAAGAAGQRLRQVAEMRAKAAGQVQQLDDFNAAKAAYPAQVEAAKAQAIAAAQKPTPDNATRWFGLDRLPQRKAGVSRARAVRLMNEPVPSAPPGSPPQSGGETWMQARTRFGDDVAGWQTHVEAVKGRLGDELGDIRAALAKADDARVSVDKLKESLTEAAGPLPVEKVEAQLSKVRGMVDAAATDGTVPASKLRQIIKNLEEAKAWRFRRAAVDIEKRLIAQHLPQENERYRRLLNQWADANELSQGAEAQFRALNKGSAPVRFDKPTKVAVAPEPQFPGGPEAETAAKQLLEPYVPPLRQLGRAVVRSTGGGVGGALGQASGIPYAGYGGAASGYSSAEALAQRWFPAVRPTVKSIVADSEAATRALARWGPHLDAALKQGPRAVRSLHRALMQADPDYRETFENAGRSAPEPLSFSAFSNGWRGR